MGLVELNEVIPYINQHDRTDIIEDQNEVIEDLIKKISKRFDTYIGRTLESTTHTEYYDSIGSNRLKLHNYPVTSITSLYEDTSRAFESASLISSDDYFIYNEKYIQLVNTYFKEWLASIKVTYVAGYTTANMPEDLKEACINEVVRNYKNRYMKGDFGVNQITTPGGTTYNISLEPLLSDTQMTLDYYML